MGFFGEEIHRSDYALDAVHELKKWAGVKDDDVFMKMSRANAIKFTKAIPKILKKMPEFKVPLKENKTDMLIQWQILGSFFIENNRSIPSKIKELTLVANDLLILECHCFRRPYIRLGHLLDFRDNIMALKEVKREI